MEKALERLCGGRAWCLHADLLDRPGEVVLLQSPARLRTEGALEEEADATGVAHDEAAAGLEAGLAVGGGIDGSDGMEADPFALKPLERLDQLRGGDTKS